MAWSQIAKTGKYAPCKNCHHIDCHEKVTIIRADCAVCDKPIAYDMFSTDENGRLAHFVCLLAEAEK